jgi:hypothetical protein
VVTSPCTTYQRLHCNPQSCSKPRFIVLLSRHPQPRTFRRSESFSSLKIACASSDARYCRSALAPALSFARLEMNPTIATG